MFLIVVLSSSMSATPLKYAPVDTITVSDVCMSTYEFVPDFESLAGSND